jgi:hypothetical protein
MIHDLEKMMVSCSNEQTRTLDSLPTKGNSPYSSVPDIAVHQAGVYKLLYNINQHKATGPNTIPGKLLKELASEISPISTTIYNASIKQGKIPNQWKEALITPLYFAIQSICKFLECDRQLAFA